MRIGTLVWRSLRFHRRTHTAVALGVVAGTAVLTGALILGDSMRGSLRDLALGRLGRIDFGLSGERFFREALAADLIAMPGFAERVSDVVPVTLVRASSTHAETQARVGKVSLYGVGEGFFGLDSEIPPERADELMQALGKRRSVVLNQALARDLAASVGDKVLLRVEKAGEVHKETVLGRNDDGAVTLRVTVRAILPSQGVAAFSARPGQGVPRNAFLAREDLHEALEREGRANTLLISLSGEPSDREEIRGELERLLSSAITLEDAELRIRTDGERGYLALESDRLLIEPLIESIAFDAMKEARLSACPIYTYLANSLVVTKRSDGVEVPYSTVTAVDLSRKLDGVGSEFVDEGGSSIDRLSAGEIVLSSWAADDLGVKPGEPIEMSYYVEGAHGVLETRTARFSLVAIARMTGFAGDPLLSPSVKGMTDVDDIADWNSPFPIDLDKIRDKDEAYWDEHRATPKAFLNLAEAQALFSGEENRFGRLTTIQGSVTDGGTLTDASLRFDAALRSRLDLDTLGLALSDLRGSALSASRGATDFGGLFVGFSLFIIISAAMLVSLLFRLGVERRSKEVGMLRALGYRHRSIKRILLAEGGVVAIVGAAIGVLGSIGFAWLMLFYLRSSWSESMGAGFLTLHASPLSLAIGGAAGFLVSLASIALGLRGLKHLSPRALLSGAVVSMEKAGERRGRVAPFVCAVGLVGALGLLVAGVSGVVPPQGAFFGVGSLFLIGFLAGFLVRVRRRPKGLVRSYGAQAMVRLGVRSASMNPRRTLSTVALVASASFVLIAVGAFRQQGVHDPTDRESGTGGFSLMAESAIPIYDDLDSNEGRDELALSSDLSKDLSGSGFFSLRLSDGDESSCLNLYQPTRPRVIGAPENLIERGGFSFASTLAETDEERENPWRLLNRTFPDGAIPVIGDSNSVQYQLKSGLGKLFPFTDELGRSVSLRFVALFSGSALQGEVVVSEENFVRLFPTTSGHRFFLVECDSGIADRVALGLEKELGDFGFDVTRTDARLMELHAVENTYLSTFQILGGFGLLLGTLGLGTVVLRNVLERRGEYALMRAVGYRKSNLGMMVLAENSVLLGGGLLIGATSAGFAIAPQILGNPGEVSWLTLALSLLAVFATGMFSGSFAMVSTVRAPLVPSLRSE